jgi:spiro-SPASM protein
VPAAAPLIDPSLIDAMIDHHHDTKHESRLTFTQAPPGLTGIVMDAALARELAEKIIPIGWVLSYKPDHPQKDLIFQPCCFEIPAELRHTVGRLTADTDRSMERLAALLAAYDEPDPVTIGRWLDRRELETVESLPREVEIELGTDDPYPQALLLPRGSRVPKRGPVDPAIVERIVKEITRYDDALVILGGFGDPLRHPQFAAILQRIRSIEHSGHSLYGLAVRTNAADLTQAHIEAMVECGVDILEVTLDAWTPERYRRLQSPGDPATADLNDVLRRLDRLTEHRQRRETVKPILLPSLTKARDNVHELDDFHDGWLRRVGAVAIHGFSHYGRRFEDRSVISMAPKPRTACRRLRSRCVVLADGRVTLCDQDIDGQHAVGRIGDRSLEELWRSDSFECVREAHRQGHFDVNPLCAACDEWHRP